MHVTIDVPYLKRPSMPFSTKGVCIVKSHFVNKLGRYIYLNCVHNLTCFRLNELKDNADKFQLIFNI